MHTMEGTHNYSRQPAKAQPPGDLGHAQRDVRIRSKTSKINVNLSFSCRSSPLPRTKNQYTLCAGFSFCAREGTSNKAAAFMPQAISPVGCCLACGSQSIGMSIRGVLILYRFLFVRPDKNNPNLFPIGDGVGFFVFFGKFNRGFRQKLKSEIID